MTNESNASKKEADTSALIDSAVQQFNLGEVSSVKRQEAKGDRLVFKVETEKGISIVKAAAPNTNEEKLEKDIFILNYLEKFDFPAPRLIKTANGVVITHIGDRAVYAYQFIEGDHPKPSVEYFEKLGALLARLHSLPINEYPYQSDFVPEKVLPKVKTEISQITDSDEKEGVQEVIEDIDNFPSFDHLPKAIIHTDAYFSNLIQNGGELYLIDLDDAGIAPAIIDIGYVLAHSCTTEPSDRVERGLKGEGIIWHEDWAESFLKAYQQVRPLNDDELKLLPEAAKFGMLVYIKDWEKERLSVTRFERYKLIKNKVNNLLSNGN